MNGLAQVVGAKLQSRNERIGALEAVVTTQGEKLEQLQLRQAELSSKVEAMAAATRVPGQSLNTQLEELRAQIQENKAPVPTPGVNNTALPYEMRTHAVIANLGWDTPEADIIHRAKALLTEAGVPNDVHSAVGATRRQGSMAELIFHEATQLGKTRLAVKALNKTLHGTRPVWLDAKRTRE